VTGSSWPSRTTRYVACSNSAAASARRAGSTCSAYVTSNAWIACQSSKVLIAGRSGAQAVEHLAHALEAAHDRCAVSLGLDRRAEDLQLEHAVVAGVEQQREQPLDRDVAVADGRTIAGGERADPEVADLHERDDVDVLAHDLVEAAPVHR